MEETGKKNIHRKEKNSTLCDWKHLYPTLEACSIGKSRLEGHCKSAALEVK